MPALATSSPLDSIRALPPSERAEFLASLTDDEAAALLYDWRSWARPAQLAPPDPWHIWLLLSGRGYGKTRVGAEQVREWSEDFELVNLIGPSAPDVRDIMVDGESGILAVCPPWRRPVYRPSTRSLRWPSGAKTLCFSAEDPEQLRGPQHEKLWADEIAAWPNHTRDEAWDLAMFGLRLGSSPQVIATTTPKPVPLLRELVEDPNVVITKGTSYENRANLAPEWFENLIRKYEGTRLGRQELDAELLLDEGLAYRVVQGVHIIPPFDLPDTFARFESMDYGTNNPCWLAHATDYEGNVITFGLEATPGLPSEQAVRIKERRLSWWAKSAKGELIAATCWAPPDIKGHAIKKDVHGNEITAEHEFGEHGIYFATAQNDRRAGYLRVAEMLKPDPERLFPDWHPRAGETGAPSAYIFGTDELEPLVKNLRDAPLEDPNSPASRWPGEAVDMGWEQSHGHAHAAYRYGLMSRPSSSKEPEKMPQSPDELRQARVATRLDRMKKREQEDLVDV